MRKTRAGVVALVGIVSVPVVIAGMAWACGPSGYGTPESPPAPVATAPSTTAPPAAQSPAETGSGAQPPAPVQVTIESGAATTGSARERSGAAPRIPSQVNSQARSIAPTPSARADINARINGSTAGVVRSRGQAVFASSTAPRAAKASRGKSPARSKARSTPAVSQRAATADLWGGISTADANLASAAALGENGGGISGGLLAALAAFGLGLVGITGAALATARRRRAAAGAADRQ